MAKQKVVRCALVGTGHQGGNHLRALDSLGEIPDVGTVELVGVADVDFARAGKVASGRGVPAFRTVAELLRGVRPDYVINATGNEAHVPVALEVLPVCDLMTEKPVAPSFDQGQQVADLAGQHGRTVRPVYTWADRLAGARRLVPSLGRLTHAEARFVCPDIPPPSGYHKRETGGALRDLGAHPAIGLFSMIPARPIAVGEAELFGDEGRRRVGQGFTADDTARFGIRCDDGMVARITVSWVADRKILSLTLYGEDGTSLEVLLYDEGDTRSYAAVLRRPGHDPENGPQPLGYYESLAETHRNFARARVGLEPLNIGLRQALDVERMIGAVPRAAAQDRLAWVDI